MVGIYDTSIQGVNERLGIHKDEGFGFILNTRYIASYHNQAATKVINPTATQRIKEMMIMMMMMMMMILSFCSRFSYILSPYI
jgi:hypothetical protein